MSKVAPWHEQGRALAVSLGTSKATPWQIPSARARTRLSMNKVAPWHGQSIPWQGLTKLDLGVDQVKVRLVSFLDVSYWSSGNGLTSTIRRGVSSPRGGMGIEARKTLEHALGNHAKARPMVRAAPSRLDSNKPRLTPKIPLARARQRLGISKAAPWHGQGIPWQGLTKLDLGVDQVKVRLVSFLDVSYWSSGNGLTSTIRRGVSSPRGGMGMEARKTLEHVLGNHGKARPTNPWSEPPRAPANIQGA
ncbi:hypothetical protein Scep_014663 [Stephania cephalantha]|uniref:Uncharacterized protein n=1 Tax=Stephania cephalantha TaxID=152367 RepID=A0AAP0J1F4_9MAGN